MQYPSPTMALAPGDRAGSYEVLGAIGAGGMGEVYRARDGRLGRDVALKILPAVFAQDPERLARFQREAQLLASLNHPNIAAIYGLEPVGDSTAIVMELVEGETLAALIARGRIDADSIRSIAHQMALALEAAHEQGIIHRDLKPANVTLKPDGTVKVLDFGLAKAIVPAAPGHPVAESPTITSPAMTAIGTILGTAAYMAPEQARGKAVDRRVDIWAFGCVWFELLTGHRVFDGDEVSDTLASVLRAQPDWSRLPPDLPPTSRLFLERCLEKDPRRRVRDIGDVRLALEGAFDVLQTGAGGRSRQRWLLPAVAIGATVGALLTAAVAWRTPSSPATPDQPVVRFETHLAPDLTFSASVLAPLAVISDTGHLLFSASPGALRPNRLYRRALDQFAAEPFEASEEAIGSVFLSPDEEWLGFIRMSSPDYLLQKMRMAGGPAVTLTRFRAGDFVGASWGRGGVVAFTSAAGVNGLAVVSESGGESREVTTPTDGESHVHPHFLPDGNRLLFTRRRQGVPDHVVLLDLATGDQQDLVEGSWPRYAPTGHLLFAREGAMWAVAFDHERLEMAGDPLPVLADVSEPAAFSYSQRGVLAYRSQAAEAATTLVWVDREGAATPLAQGTDQYWLPRLSPDGRRLAVGIGDDIWVIDLERGGRTRLTSGETSRQFPFAWTRDGRSVTLASPDSNRVLQVAADGSGGRRQLLSGPNAQWPTDWAPGDRTLAYYLNAPTTTRDLWTLPAGPSSSPSLFLGTPFQERAARFSPDGRWLLYVSNESGRDEVYVRPYPGPGDPIAISAAGGTEPVWARSGDEVFYRLNTEMYVRPFDTATGRPSGDARRLFVNDTLSLELGGIGGNASYDHHPGGRFIMLSGTPIPTRVRVVLNWFDELRRLVPVD